jgi:hypothetical protein
MANPRRYQELLSGTPDRVEIAAYEIIISRLKAKLAAMGPAHSVSTSTDWRVWLFRLLSFERHRHGVANITIFAGKLSDQWQ